MSSTAVERVRVRVRDRELEVFLESSEPPAGALRIATAHPAEAMSEAAVGLLQSAAGVPAHVVALNPCGLGGSSARPAITAHTLEDMVDEIDAARRALGVGPWVFWGM